MREALFESEDSVATNGYQIRWALRYTGDVVLIEGSMKKLQELIDRMKTASEISFSFSYSASDSNSLYSPVRIKPLALDL